MGAHTGGIRVPTRVGDPLRAAQAVNHVYGGQAGAGARQQAIPWGNVEERWVQMDMGAHWEEGISGLHVGKEEKGRDGCNGGAGW